MRVCELIRRESSFGSTSPLTEWYSLFFGWREHAVQWRQLSCGLGCRHGKPRQCRWHPRKRRWWSVDSSHQLQLPTPTVIPGKGPGGVLHLANWIRASAGASLQRFDVWIVSHASLASHCKLRFLSSLQGCGYDQIKFWMNYLHGDLYVLEDIGKKELQKGMCTSIVAFKTRKSSCKENLK